MRLFKKTLSLAFLFTSSLLILSCGGEDPFGVDYSLAPDPYPIEGAEKVESETGLVYYIIEEGSGEEVSRRSSVSVYYTGRTMDGEIFDSSYRNGSLLPRDMGDLGALVDGFREGLLGMKEGGKRVLIIPPHLGYGDTPSHQLSDDTLRFDVELDKIAY